MPKFALQLQAQFTNVTSLLPGDGDYTLMVKTKCTSCHEVHPKLIGITPSDEKELQKGRDTANLVMKCNFCKKEASAKFDEPTSKAPLYRPIEANEDSGAEFQTLCVLEFRGLEPVEFVPQGTWTCKGLSSGTVFDAVEFDDGKEWMDYDEKAGDEVSIMELESRWQRA
ncbi:uncharacterized protein PFL1_05140 [Pseudozyma flocculosa PF-1]|uniref:Related to DUF866 domain protein n=2 Tax=Pseudozyma flocculosa TaxID=84751 RepID=A0A5C3F8B2_9BASI|nr:uncharacterized protein PFL1_05140 [Pseudozyma flocculosa PF-1]EPQ27217.1 hypothetical protein PFL1_05140 [Pseudozyma flocculosa PF-1]SPO39581.1 related to DUF866 domain protein [Pseudozyma flocculosa]